MCIEATCTLNRFGSSLSLSLCYLCHLLNFVRNIQSTHTITKWSSNRSKATLHTRFGELVEAIMEMGVCVCVLWHGCVQLNVQCCDDAVVLIMEIAYGRCAIVSRTTFYLEFSPDILQMVQKRHGTRRNSAIKKHFRNCQAKVKHKNLIFASFPTWKWTIWWDVAWPDESTHTHTHMCQFQVLSFLLCTKCFR